MINATTLLAMPALHAAVCFALDSGVFYDTDFKAACRPVWDAHHPASGHRLPDVVRRDSDTHENRRTQYKDAAARVQSGPRGTWLVLVTIGDGGQRRYESCMSDGTGEVHTRSDGWAEMPTFAAVLDRMVGYEIYTARKAVEGERRRVAAAARLQNLGLRPGMTLRGVRVGRETYSTVVVEEANASNGCLTLYGTKRGSRNRFRIQTTALGIEVMKPVVTAAPANHSTGLFSA